MQNGTRGILFHITNKGGRILEQQFDKQKMSQLVKQAMGEKTPFEYCRLSKLNSEYIDRLMTMHVKKPPSIGIMQQIAASSQGLVTLRELKMAAGYEQDETEIHPETGERTQPPKKTTEVLRTEIDGCIQTLQEAAKDAEKRQQYLERFSHENQEDLMTVPKENIHIPEKFLNTKPEARKTAVAKDTESVTADAQTLPEPKKMKKEKRSLKKTQTEQMPEQKAAMAMQRAVMAMAQSDPEPEITKTCTETMTKQPETQGPAANDRIRKERNAMELAMYRNMGKRRCYRVYGDEPEADVFRFRDERGMVAVYDFTLAGKEIYGFDDVCALYGRMKALRPDETVVYIVCAGGKAAKALKGRMEHCFGACKNFGIFWKEKGGKGWE